MRLRLSLLVCVVLGLPFVSFAEEYSFDFSGKTKMFSEAFSIGEIASIDKSVLRADSTNTGKLWNNYLISNPNKLIICGGKSYVVEFDYRIVKEASFPHDHGYFYFFVRTPKGTKFDVWRRWEGKSGMKGHLRYVIELPEQHAWRIYFGIKGQGIIEIDNLRIGDVNNVKSNRTNRKPLYVHIGFEQNEPVRWSILQNAAKIVSGKNGNYLLADTTSDKIRTWRRYLQIAPSQIGIKKNTCYSVQFDYKILKSPSYFQLLERGSRGWRLVLSWSGPEGYEGKGEIIFTSDKRRASPLIFGMKGPGAIIIDNIVIREWKNAQQAKEGLKAAAISVKALRAKIADIERKLAKWRCSGVSSDIEAKVKKLEERVKKQSLTIAEKISVYKEIIGAERDVFKLEVKNATKSCKLAYVTFVDNSLKKIRKDAVYDYKGKGSNKVNLYCGGNEYESFQIVVVPFRDITGLRLQISDLKCDDGKSVIKKSNVKWYKVEYVDTQKELYPVEYVGLWPDPLEPVEKVDISSLQYVQPIWVTVYVPANMPKGRYVGTLTLKAPNLPARNIRLAVEVRNFSLPKKATFKTSFAARDAAGYYVKWGLVKKGNPVLKNIDRLYRDALLEHRLSPARISSVKPKLKRKITGDYYVDFSGFDEDLNHYIAKGINCFTFGGYWGWRNHLKGEKQKFVVWPDGQDKPETIILDVLSEPFNKLMHDYFASWANYLETKGCLDDVYCYIYDEPGMNEIDKVNKLLAILHGANRRLQAIIPGIPNRKFPETYSINVDIMCPLLAGIELDRAKELQKRGKHSWWYVCLNPRHPYPNFFVDYPAIDHRIIMWMSWKYAVEGLLYWQTTYWYKSNPWENIETYTTTHGDGCLFYPSRTQPIRVVPSIRLETIRDGVEDYEYFAILKRALDRIQRDNIKVDSKLLADARKMLSVPDDIVGSLSCYTKSPERILSYRRRLGDIIDKLQSYKSKR